MGVLQRHHLHLELMNIVPILLRIHYKICTNGPQQQRKCHVTVENSALQTKRSCCGGDKGERHKTERKRIKLQTAADATPWKQAERLKGFLLHDLHVHGAAWSLTGPPKIQRSCEVKQHELKLHRGLWSLCGSSYLLRHEPCSMLFLSTLPYYKKWCARSSA